MNPWLAYALGCITVPILCVLAFLWLVSLDDPKAMDTLRAPADDHEGQR